MNTVEMKLVYLDNKKTLVPTAFAPKFLAKNKLVEEAKVLRDSLIANPGKREEIVAAQRKNIAKIIRINRYLARNGAYVTFID